MTDLTTQSLQNLQSDGERKVMDIVDKLRRQGLNSILELPQLVVCGDQSSGKSSVLEAITEIPFPRKENLCTRFATEIVLRRQSTDRVSITISPGDFRNEEERTKLMEFTKTIESLHMIPKIIEEATLAMGLGPVGTSKSRAFSSDVLCVEICGPNRPQLTLVDLPGLIHATNKAQTAKDKDVIQKMVQKYMSNPRTIILAVVSAKNDFANQVILDHCQKIDKNGRRTLGIITKPDYLRQGSENEKSWIDLALNKDIYLERGWHILRNRADNEMDFTFEQRHEKEEAFFNTGRFVGLPRNTVGIDSLRTRLSNLLLSDLIKELPALKEEMDKKMQETKKQLESLGEKRDTMTEQRVLLTKISTNITAILTAAVNGHYSNEFFDAVDTKSKIDADANVRRLRAVIQHHNSRFSEIMRIRGHRYEIQPVGGLEQPEKKRNLPVHDDINEDAAKLPNPKSLSHEHAIAWVRSVMVRSRGHELPGTFNPDKEIANFHIEDIVRVCRTFMRQVLQYAAPEFKERLAVVAVDDILEKALLRARKELVRLINDKARHPMTYNPHFVTTIQQNRHDNYKNLVSRAQVDTTKTYTLGQYNEQRQLVDPIEFSKQMDTFIEQDMDKFAAEEALNNQEAYYKDELKYFVHAVTKQVIERHLINPLPESILSPLVVAKMTDNEVSYIAAESKESIAQRTHLEEKKRMLENGLGHFYEVMGGFKR
ncbi:dynamin family protein-like protein [Aaosphaeria arxii CBS 175.79]|uniref:Dynamin family protein-like protein n=1 Tax=Aaosphaeria arxii CBS 175.79 TaxID=1450172 RepID=A0A6A5XV66_9PLEO|nr:dynamin family protein-like protein [Aaosphaeria arxii CBS 175.79]KAF2017208.1 dynamin family protein-like protein [Aaosphaeria arxii CBS 175.79]